MAWTIRRLANRDGTSLNQAALKLLRRGAGPEDGEVADTVGSSLDHLIGFWSDAETDEIERALNNFETTGENRETEGRRLKNVVNLEEKFGLLPEYWQQPVVAELNDYQFKIARVKGEFVWHAHADSDEAFFVLEGTLRIDLPDGAVEIGPGELYVIL